MCTIFFLWICSLTLFSIWYKFYETGSRVSFSGSFPVEQGDVCLLALTRFLCFSIISLKALSREAQEWTLWIAPSVHYMFSKEQMDEWHAEKKNGNMSYAFYFWQHVLAVLGQKLYQMEICLERGGKCAGLWIISPDAAAIPLPFAGVSWWTWGQIPGWQTAHLLCDTSLVGELDMLLWGITHHISCGPNQWGGEAQGPRYPPPGLNLP